MRTRLVFLALALWALPIALVKADVKPPSDAADPMTTPSRFKPGFRSVCWNAVSACFADVPGWLKPYKLAKLWADCVGTQWLESPPSNAAWVFYYFNDANNLMLCCRYDRTSGAKSCSDSDPPSTQTQPVYEVQLEEGYRELWKDPEKRSPLGESWGDQSQAERQELQRALADVLEGIPDGVLTTAGFLLLIAALVAAILTVILIFVPDLSVSKASAAVAALTTLVAVSLAIILVSGASKQEMAKELTDTIYFQ